VYFLGVTPGTLHFMVIVSRVLEINCGFAEEISKTTITEKIYSFDIFGILHGILANFS